MKITEKKQIIKKNGQSLIEVVIALAILLLVVLSLTRITAVSLRNINSAKNQAKATRYAQEWIEDARALRDRQGSSFFTTLCGGTDKLDNDFFTRTRTCTLLNPTTVEVKVIASWTDGSGSHQSELTTQLTIWN